MGSNPPLRNRTMFLSFRFPSYHFSPLLPPFSLHIHSETTRSFFIPLSSSLVLRASRLDCLFLSSSLSLSEQSTPSIYLNPFVWRCLCPSHPSVCLSVSLCRIEYYPLNFNPAGIEPQLTNRTIDFTEEFQINFRSRNFVCPALTPPPRPPTLLSDTIFSVKSPVRTTPSVCRCWFPSSSFAMFGRTLTW